jgi:hypothetical protein
VLAGTWYIGTGGAGSGGAVAGTLNGPLTGTADSAKVLTPGKALNGTTFTGADAITVPLNTTSIATSGTYYPTFVPSNTAGNQQASTHASLSYDPNTGYLSATRFVGSGAGLSGVVTSVSFNGAAAVNGAVSITSPAQVQPDWNATSGLGSILNKPALFSGSYTDLSSKPTLFSGSYTDLTNKPTIPAPAPVDSVNGLTGAVRVGALYDNIGSVAPGAKYIPASSIIHNPYVFNQLAGSYVGDYFSGHGFSLTGLTVTNFSSELRLDGGEPSNPTGWIVSFVLEFRQAFFDAYAPGYTPDNLRMVNVTMNGEGANYFLQTGVFWTGQSNAATWTTSGSGGVAVSYSLAPSPIETIARTGVSFSSDQYVYVNSRYSPIAWPYYLFLKFWVAK